MICTFPDCGRKHYGKGLCKAHHQQQWLGKDLRPVGWKPSPQDRFEKLVDRNGPINPKTGTRCHIWIGAKKTSPSGNYGNFNGGTGRTWETYVGPIPDGYDIDHDNPEFGCRNKECVNTEHLEAVPHHINCQPARRKRSA